MKGLFIHVLSKGPLQSSRLLHFQGGVYYLHAHFACFEFETMLQLVEFDLQQLRHYCKVLRVGEDSHLLVALVELLPEIEVANVQHNRKDLQDALHLLSAKVIAEVLP